MYPRRTATRVAVASTLVTALAYLLAGCGDSEPAAVAAPAPGNIEIVASDFEFDGFPDTVAVGTTVTLVNQAPTELHEVVVFRLPDGETRSADELMQLPEEELGAMFGDGPPAMVMLAAPGEEPIVAVGEPVFTEPGRYLLVCFIPTGVDPDTYFAAAAAGDGDGPPDVGGGPPHLVHGMYAEIEVVAP